MFYKQEKQNIQIDYGNNLGVLFEQSDLKINEFVYFGKYFRIKGERRREQIFLIQKKKL